VKAGAPATSRRGAPGAEIFKQREDPPDRARLACDIGLFPSPKIQLRIIAFLTQVQPEAVLLRGPSVSFELQLLTPETCMRLRAFLDDLLLKIATGEIDPFATQSE
jgi:hypothetical protein